MSFTLQVHGTQSILRASKSISKDADKAVERGVRKVVAFLIPELRKEIRRLGLVKTGAYFRNVASGELRNLVRKIGLGVYRGTIRNQMEYAIFLEGRRNFYKGHPGGFMVYENTLNKKTSEMMRIFKQELGKVR